MHCTSCGIEATDTAWLCPHCSARLPRRLFPQDIRARVAITILVPLLVYGASGWLFG